MTEQERDLLWKDLCARLPYGVKGKVYAEVSSGKYDMWGEMIFFDAPFDVILDGINVASEEIHVVAIGNEDTVDFIEMQQVDGSPYTIDDFKPYLRPISDMTEEEDKELALMQFSVYNEEFSAMNVITATNIMNWLNAHHFDYNSLIERGLANIAPDGMYK